MFSLINGVCCTLAAFFVTTCGTANCNMADIKTKINCQNNNTLCQQVIVKENNGCDGFTVNNPESKCDALPENINNNNNCNGSQIEKTVTNPCTGNTCKNNALEDIIQKILNGKNINNVLQTNKHADNEIINNTNDISVSEQEMQVVQLVNKIRRENGLNELIMDEKLCSIAGTKSLDMCENKYFSHNSPKYGTAFDMMKANNIAYKTAGENIAMGYKTASDVVNGWMNSKGHRENILNPRYTKIGVGYCPSGNYWTQMFIG